MRPDLTKQRRELWPGTTSLTLKMQEWVYFWKKKGLFTYGKQTITNNPVVKI